MACDLNSSTSQRMCDSGAATEKTKGTEDVRIPNQYTNEYCITPLSINLVPLKSSVLAALPLLHEEKEKKDVISEVTKEEESEEEQYKVKEVKSVKRRVIIISSDSEDDAVKSNSKKEESADSYESSDRDETPDKDETPSSEKTVKKTKEVYQRRSKVTKSMKEESSEIDESPSSEEDNMEEDPDFDQKEDESSDSDGSPSSKKYVKNPKERYQSHSSSQKKVTKSKESMSAYELMIQKNREEKMAFLQSLNIDEVKAGLNEMAETTKKTVQPVKRKLKAKIPTSPPVLRKSSRLANVSKDLSFHSLYYNALKSAADTVQQNPQMNEVKPVKKFVMEIISSDSEDDADKSNSKDDADKSNSKHMSSEDEAKTAIEALINSEFMGSKISVEVPNNIPLEITIKEDLESEDFL